MKRPVEELVSDFEDLRQGYLEELGGMHGAYTNSVSTPGMALSLEATATLCAVSHAPQVRRVADMGSGFSSAAFRLLAKDRVIESVSTFDDSPEWLELTREFCRERNLDDDRFEIWDDRTDNFDLVLYDLGRMDTRTRCIQSAARMCAAGGLVYYDDAHKPDYKPALKAELHGRDVYDVGLATFDDFKRFGVLAVV